MNKKVKDLLHYGLVAAIAALITTAIDRRNRHDDDSLMSDVERWFSSFISNPGKFVSSVPGKVVGLMSSHMSHFYMYTGYVKFLKYDRKNDRLFFKSYISGRKYVVSIMDDGRAMYLLTIK